MWGLSSLMDSAASAEKKFPIRSGDKPADAEDFGRTFPSGTVTFPDGETEQTITIFVSGDSTVETDEGFAGFISNPSTGSNVSLPTASGTISNDEAIQITAAGPDGGPNVIVNHAVTGEKLLNFFAYNLNFNGRGRVATGDVNNDGVADIIISPGNRPSALADRGQSAIVASPRRCGDQRRGRQGKPSGRQIDGKLL